MGKLRRASVPRSLLFVALALGCADRTLPTEGGEVVDESASAVCDEECAIFIDARPMHAARIEIAPDSADSGVFLADFTIDGRLGDALGARLDLPSDAPAELLDARITVEIDGRATRYSFRELVAGANLHEFVQAGALDVRYTLERRDLEMRDLAMRLVQLLDGGVVRSARTPWATQPAATASTGVINPDCTAAVPSPGTYCDGAATVTITPFHTGGPFGGFQSDAGTGASNPITISFSAPVSSVSITVQDPTFAGNGMVAFGPGGIVGTVNFSGSGVPGINIPQSGTVVGTITSVSLIPASADYVAYTGLVITVGGTIALLTVQCLPSPVTRGEVATCTATVPGRPLFSQFETVEWTFESDNQRIARSGVAVADTVWAGQAVSSGQVTVVADVAGEFETATADLTVLARDWSEMPLDSSVTPVQHDANVLPLRPSREPGAGGGRFGTFALTVGPALPQPIADVDDGGPHQGLAFTTSVPYRWTGEIMISPALNAGSEWWLLQPAAPQPGQCGREWVTNVLAPATIAHEGLNFEEGSHADLTRNELRQALVSPAEQFAGSREEVEFAIALNARLAHGIAKLVNETLDGPNAQWRQDVFGGCQLEWF